MTISKEPGLPFVIAGVASTIFAAQRSWALAVACFLATLADKVLDGSRGIIESYRLGPADADNPISPVAIARFGRRLIVVVIAILCAMSAGFALAAMRTNDSCVRTLSAAFAIVALAAGPGPLTLVKRRAALWTATGFAVVGTVVSLLQ
jgi:hypothetical protein